MTLFELVHTIAHAETPSANDDSLSGTVIFCGISLLLGVVALVFAWFGEPPSMMF